MEGHEGQDCEYMILFIIFIGGIIQMTSEAQQLNLGILVLVWMDASG